MFFEDRFSRAERLCTERFTAFLKKVPDLTDASEAGRQFSNQLEDAGCYDKQAAMLYPAAYQLGKRLQSIAGVQSFGEAPKPKSRHPEGFGISIIRWYQLVNEVAYGYLDAHEIANLEDGVLLCRHMCRNHWGSRNAHYEAQLIRKILPLLSTKDAVLQLGAVMCTYKGLMLLHMATSGDPAKVFQEALEQKHLDDEQAAREEETRRNSMF